MPAGDEPVVAQPEDEWDALARLNSAPESLTDDRRISFEVALVHCELRLGASWFYAPGRWGTADGCVPARVVWAWFAALSMLNALDALNTSHGIGLALGTEQAGDRARRQAMDDAFPGA